MLSEVQLNDMGNDLMQMIWGRELDIKIKINSRLTKSLGRFVIESYRDSSKKVKYIEISKRILENYDALTIESVLKHELCHYYIESINGGYGDGEADFENEILRIGSSSTNQISPAGKLYTCYCSHCGQLITKTANKRKVTSLIKNRICGRCNSKLIEGKTEYRKDTFKVRDPKFTIINNYISGKKEIIPEGNTNRIYNNSKLMIGDIVVAGKNGKVCASHVWDAVIKITTEKLNDSKERIEMIIREYPELYTRVCEGLPKKRLKYIEEIL